MTDQLPTAQPPRTSIEKVHALAAEVRELKPSTPEEAVLFNVLPMALPQVLNLLPTDPAELDALLAKGSEFVAGLQSDPTVPEVDATEEPAWDSPEALRADHNA